jgi:glyoxylase-like metal-dependent hydrolase (beta-lactamase superfamily II)
MTRPSRLPTWMSQVTAAPCWRATLGSLACSLVLTPFGPVCAQPAAHHSQGEGLALTGAAGAAQRGGASAARAVEVAAGVYLLPGAAGEVEIDNLGRIGNAGFIVGDGGVVAIDTGTSYRHGVALLAAIRRVTDRPVRLALITHTRQEFLFGATAYREQSIPIHMHGRAAALMQSRCERCLRTLRQLLGEDEMHGTAMFKPDHEFDRPHTIDTIGRRLQVLYFGHSSGPGDVALLDLQTGVLFAGGLVDELRIPDLQDADLGGWNAALRSLRELPIKRIVPGHGPVASVKVIDAVERYLGQLQTRVRELLQSGAALSEVPDAAAMPEFSQWDQYETIHRRNASVLFVRFEREQMFKQAASQN